MPKGNGKPNKKMGVTEVMGTDEADVIYAGNGKQNVYALGGDDMLSGGNGKDMLFGGEDADTLEGGNANDTMDGGAGDDSILSISWGGEPLIAQEVEDGVEKVEPDEPNDDDDVLTGGEGADTFTFRWLLDAKEDILDKHRDDDGVVNYQAVAGENDNVHDHWVETIGNDTITDFNADEDTLVFEGHTVALESATLVDADGDGEIDDTLLIFYSEQGGAGAHQGDQLGTVTLLDAAVTADDVEIDAGVFYGVESPYDAGA